MQSLTTVRPMAVASLGTKSRTWYVCGMSTSFGCFEIRNCCSPATNASGVYGSSFADSTAYTFATFFPATSAAMDAAEPPTTAASSDQPVAAAIACPAVMVSHETRFSFPSRCSTTTRIVSAIIKFSVLGSQQDRPARSMWGQPPSPVRPSKARQSLQHSQLIPQLIHQLLRNLRWRPVNMFRLLRLLRNVQLLNFLQILPQRSLHLGQRHLPQRLVLGLFDADQSGIAQLVDAGLDRQHRRRGHVDKLEVSGFELALHANPAVGLFNLHDDGRVRPSQQLRQDDARLRISVIVGLQPSEDKIKLFVFDRRRKRLRGVQGI